MSDNTRLTIAGEHECGGSAPIANGDPYVVHLSKTPDDSKVPTQTKTICLGTGYHTLNGIGQHITALVNRPEDFDIDIGFTPDHADVFALHAELEFEPRKDSTE